MRQVPGAFFAQEIGGEVWAPLGFRWLELKKDGARLVYNHLLSSE
jgi:hypothetical protein